MAFFQKSLQDLVKGVRNAGPDASAFVAKELQTIKQELKERDLNVKCVALQKLIYLNMQGHEMAWAAFHVIEVMSQERFALKRVGLLAASLTFTPSTDVLVLCTQLLKKEFQAKSPFEIGLGINTLANIATEDLARDLLSDVVSMLTSSRPYIRKRATLVLYKLYLRYPQGLRLTFDHLKRRLTDDAVAVQCAAVNVVCELARRKPENYLELAPELFTLLTGSANTWMTIKVVKLLSSLVAVEPRLARKLLEPLANIVQTTGAKSLQYEAMFALTVALQHTKKADGSDAKNAPAVVRLVTDRLREFVREPDQNLKYLGLTGLVELMKSNPRVVAEHRELVLACLLDEDVTIRARALELIAGMVTRRNLPDIIGSLLGHLESAEGHYRDNLIEKIITMCSRDKYAYLSDFGWYIGVLAKLAYLPGIARHGATIAGQMIDVAVRVEEARPNAVQALLPMLADPVLFQNARGGVVAGTSAAADGAGAAAGGEGGAAAAAAAADEASMAAVLTGGTAGTGASQVLYAAAWIVGEFCSIIPPRMHGAVIDALLAPSVAQLPAGVQAAYVQCALKVLAAAAGAALKAGEAGPDAPFLASSASVLARLHPFAQSIHVEVQERACLAQQLLATLGVPFTALPTKAAEAAAKAKAEADLMALAAGGDAAPPPAGAPGAPPSPSKVAAAAGVPPLEPDVRLIAGVLASLFSEALRPVNPKAQRKVAVPAGLSLDAWINPAEAEGDAEDKSGKAALQYANVSFEDSYGVKDDEYAGSKHDGAGGGGGGAKMYDVGGGADEDDDAWFDDMNKKNRKRDKELWGGDAEGGGDKDAYDGMAKDVLKAACAARGLETGGKKEEMRARLRAADKKEAAGKKKKGAAGGAYMLSSSKSSGGGRDAADEPDVDAIPIKKLGAGELKPNALAMDISIFGDFGAKGKGADKAKGKKGKSKRGADEDDAPAPAGKAFKVIDDDDMPEGADADETPFGGADDDDGDALAKVDLRTALGADEVLPAQRHRAVLDPAALQVAGAARGRGRAAGGGRAGDAPPADAAAGKPKKKKADAAGAAGGGGGGGAAAADAKPKKSKKADAAAAAAAPAPAPAAAEDKPKKKKAAAAAAAPVTQGESVAAAEAHEYTLAKDKVVLVKYIVVADPAGGPVAVLLRVEPRSSKKGVETLDAAFAAVEGAAVSGGAPGAPAGALRLAAGLKPKDKGKPAAAKKATLAVALSPAALAAGAAVPVTLTYTTGKGEPVALEATLVLRAAAALVPTVVDAEGYRAVMTAEAAKFVSAVGTAPLVGGSAGAPDAGEATIAAAAAAFRAYAVARSPRHAILFARTPGAGGAAVTALVKVDDASGLLQITVKSALPDAPGHAAALLKDIQDVVAAVIADKAKAAGKDDE